MINKYRADCDVCGQVVKAKAGRLEFTGPYGYKVTHLACSAKNTPQVITTTFSSGESVTRNINGMCEDAPCCGCCT
jgi:hypothetical protein